MKIYIILHLLLLILIGEINCVKEDLKNASRDNIKADKPDLVRGLTLDQKIGQMIIAAIPGTKMNNSAQQLIKEILPGGIILFGYNLNEKDSIKVYIDGLQKESMAGSGIPLFISIDQEGGRVKRIVREATQFPGNMAAGSGGDGELAYRMARVLGLQLRALGINMNYAPVLDVNNNPDNPVINTRSFGSDTGTVSLLGKRYIRGLQDSSCIAVGKHFPGHGDTNSDSHLTLPVIPYDMSRLNAVEFPPFIEAIKENVEGIMTAHISFPEILKRSEPATLSREFLTDILRVKMNFKGLVITDDMEMNAISKVMIGESAVKSILAGADIILSTSYGRNVNIISDTIKKAVAEKRIPLERIDESVRRILDVKLRYNIISLNKNKIEEGVVIHSEHAAKILSEAQNINHELSRKALYYQGDRKLLLSGRDISRVFITGNRYAAKNLIFFENDSVFGNEKDFMAAGGKSGSRKVVYYHVEDYIPDMGRIKNFYDYCIKSNIEIVILSSGNPYPILRSDSIKNLLMTFSNTEESIRQMAFCLNGVFTPDAGSTIFRGIPGRK